MYAAIIHGAVNIIGEAPIYWYECTLDRCSYTFVSVAKP